jgi:hypothetical protein
MNLIISGCSFSVDTAWPKYITDYNIINLSTPGAGMQTISQNLIMQLEVESNFKADNSCVIINITQLDRVDTMCSLVHPDANCRLQNLGIGWINEGGFTTRKPPFNGTLQKNIELEQIKILNCLQTISAINYLENNNYVYGILLLENLLHNPDTPQFFKDFLQKRDQKIIKFGAELGMFEYAQTYNQLQLDNFHPDDLANQYFSQGIQQYLAINHR